MFVLVGAWAKNSIFRSCPQFLRGFGKRRPRQKSIVPVAPASLTGDAVQNGRIPLQGQGGAERKQVRGRREGGRGRKGEERGRPSQLRESA